MPHRIRILFAKELLGTITPEEKLELDAWINASSENKKFKQEYVNQERASEAMKDLLLMDSARIRKKVEKHIKRSGVYELPRRRTNWSFISRTAAAILLAAFGVWYFGIRRGKKDIYDWAKEAADQLAENRVERKKAVLIAGTELPFDLEDMTINQVMDKNGFRITRTDSQTVSVNDSALWEEGEGPPRKAVFTAPPGQSWRISLIGIGNIEIVPGTSLALLPTTADGTVLALDGRAYFDINHHPNSVFSVVTKLIRADDLGTAFDISSRDSICTALLVSGSLKVTNGAKSIVLKPGNEASVRDAKGDINISNVPDINRRLAWRSAAFEFDNLSIPQFMHQVTEWYCLKGVVYDKMVDTATKKLLGGGHLGKNLKLRELLDLLQNENTMLHFEVRGKYIYVTTIPSTSLAIGGLE